MIYYPISILMRAGITEILIITTPDDISSFKKLLSDGSQFGCSFTYAIQKVPNGLAQAFVIGEQFIGKDSVALILGDNIFYGTGLDDLLIEKHQPYRRSCFCIPCFRPRKIWSCCILMKIKKPFQLRKNQLNQNLIMLLPGLYFYDNQVIEMD